MPQQGVQEEQAGQPTGVPALQDALYDALAFRERPKVPI